VPVDKRKFRPSNCAQQDRRSTPGRDAEILKDILNLAIERNARAASTGAEYGHAPARPQRKVKA
jgi:hypothetical protein